MIIYLKLFWNFLQIGLFSFGGGYAVLPLIESKIVNENQWITRAEFLDIVTISQMIPGPVAITSATFTGNMVAGIPGAIVATVASVTPSCIIVLLLAFLYGKFQDIKIVRGILGGLRPAVVALIAAAGVTISMMAIWPGDKISLKSENMDYLAAVFFIPCLFLIKKFKFNPIFLMLGAGLFGFLIYLLTDYKF